MLYGLANPTLVIDLEVGSPRERRTCVDPDKWHVAKLKLAQMLILDPGSKDGYAFDPSSISRRTDVSMRSGLCWVETRRIS